MSTDFEKIIDSLSPIQKQAVDLTEGAALVLAGPGAGKTRVLTARIARLLKESEGQNFKILALTFTTKAAAEMKERVEVYMPGVADSRTFIGTFHAFCTQTLKQHGSHIDIQPDFGIYDQISERQALLQDALGEAISEGKAFSASDVRWLSAIDRLKARLVTPEKANKYIRDSHMPEVYRLYEAALKKENALDFNGIILETCRLLASMPAVAKKIRRTYRFWMIDEFQDTTPAQYWLITYMSDDNFKNIFTVADDDQIIFQWAGASYKQIEKFRTDFQPELIQLVENHRCPAEVVSIANKLVTNNTHRTPDKKEIISTKEIVPETIVYNSFETELEEQEYVVNKIAELDKSMYGGIAIIGRTRKVLGPILDRLKEKGVDAVLSQRRDSFVSPQFVWLQACLDQSTRPTDKRVFITMVNAGNRIIKLELDPETLMAEAEASGLSYVEHWSTVVKHTATDIAKKLSLITSDLADNRSNWKKITREAISTLKQTDSVSEEGISDVDEDHMAWESCLKEIRAELGPRPELSEVMQGLALRSKEPPKNSEAISLLTIHSSKGLEFDKVFLVGMAEDILPSWQSRKEGDDSIEMEEERRNCFVGITRVKKQLYLTRSSVYQGRKKEPSRFLNEMALL